MCSDYAMMKNSIVLVNPSAFFMVHVYENLMLVVVEDIMRL